MKKYDHWFDDNENNISIHIFGNANNSGYSFYDNGEIQSIFRYWNGYVDKKQMLAYARDAYDGAKRIMLVGQNINGKVETYERR